MHVHVLHCDNSNDGSLLRVEIYCKDWNVLLSCFVKCRLISCYFLLTLVYSKAAEIFLIKWPKLKLKDINKEYDARSNSYLLQESLRIYKLNHWSFKEMNKFTACQWLLLTHCLCIKRKTAKPSWTKNTTPTHTLNCGSGIGWWLVDWFCWLDSWEVSVYFQQRRQWK